MPKHLKSLLNRPQPAAAGESAPLNAYCTVGALPPLDFPHAVLAQRDLSDPELRPHLEGFIGYVLSRGDRQMSVVRYHLMRHLQRVQNHLSLQVPDSALPAFGQWAQRANAVTFMPDGSVRDPQGQVLIDSAGRQDPAAALPHPADAWERKARSEATLARHNAQALPSLPPVPGAAETQWRTPADAAARATALVAVAVYAESVGDGQPLNLARLRERLPAAFEHLSPKEQAFFQAREPGEKTVSEMGWRYESLALLAWALGLLPDLPYPAQICDAAALTRLMRQTAAAADWPRQARLRPADEILDALDLHYRLHWLTREAGLGRRELPPGLNPDVVMERHYALNWLTRFEDADWDEVDTPT